MESTLEDSDILFVWLPSDIELYDIVIIDPDDLDHMLVKRVVALPGDTVQIFDGFLYVNGEFMGNDVYCDEAMKDAGIAGTPIVLGDNQYFVLGDNRNNSSDSRYLGAFDEDEILGVVKARLFPEFTIF